MIVANGTRWVILHSFRRSRRDRDRSWLSRFDSLVDALILQFSPPYGLFKPLALLDLGCQRLFRQPCRPTRLQLRRRRLPGQPAQAPLPQAVYAQMVGVLDQAQVTRFIVSMIAVDVVNIKPVGDFLTKPLL
jgi:hypothetical protein